MENQRPGRAGLSPLLFAVTSRWPRVEDKTRDVDKGEL
jgi:hypothetical protein